MRTLPGSDDRQEVRELDLAPPACARHLEKQLSRDLNLT
jgi:hypothetical protein